LLEQTIREWNRYAALHRTVGADIDIAGLEQEAAGHEGGAPQPTADEHHDHGEAACHCGNSEPHEHHHHHHESGEREAVQAHHSHAHVMALTHYFAQPIDSESFELMMSRLPDDIYRAKGILTFTDTSSRFMFQYAYKQLDLMRIQPQGEVPDVAVFIGEHFDKPGLMEQLQQLSK
jgi:G3E family GTPase